MNHMHVLQVVLTHDDGDVDGHLLGDLPPPPPILLHHTQLSTPVHKMST